MRVSLNRTVSIYTLYITSHDQIDQNKLEDLIKQLSKAFILLGVFNSYNTICGSMAINRKKEKLLKNPLWTMSYVCSKQGAPSGISTATGSLSTIDLTVCDPAFYWDITWNVYDNTWGSDHFLIILRNSKVIDVYPNRWRLSKADWEKFRNLSKLIQNKPEKAENVHGNPNIHSKKKSIVKSRPRVNDEYK